MLLQKFKKMYIFGRIEETFKCLHVMNVVDYGIHFPRNTVNKPTMHYCTQQLTNQPCVVVEENGVWPTTRYI
jgi:hypothetical protein